MRIGLTGLGATAEQVVRQAQRAEEDGFSGLWYTSIVAGDPLVAMAMAAQQTSRVELGTAILQTYVCHPVIQASRFLAAASASGAPERFTLGLGPSHEPMIEGIFGLSYATPGRHTEEYVKIVTALFRGERVDVDGEELRVHAGPLGVPDGVEIPVLVSALAPRLLRVAGQHAAGTVLWMANAKAVDEHVVPRITKAAADAGRPAPRVVAGLPVCVHDDVPEARAAAAKQFVMYGQLPNYQRILAHGGIGSPAEAAIVGDEASVTQQIETLFEVGATDVWAAPFAVGDDPKASRARTRALLKELAGR